MKADSARDSLAQDADQRISTSGGTSQTAPVVGSPDASGRVNAAVSWDLGDLSAGPRYRGAIERCDLAGLSGWCIATDDLTSAIELEIYAGNMLLTTVKTGLPRPDIATATAQDECLCGFHLSWSKLSPVAIREALASTEGAWQGALPQVRLAKGMMTLGFLPDVLRAFSGAAFRDHLQQIAQQAETIIEQDALLQLPIAMLIDKPDQEAEGNDYDEAADVEALADADESPPEPEPEEVDLPVGSRHVAVPFLDSAYIRDGGWRIEARQILGWLNPREATALRLSVWCDGAVIARIDVPVEPPANTPYVLLAPFCFLLPLTLTDNQPHEIKVTPELEPECFLRHIDGSDAAIYRRRVVASIDSTDDGIIRGWAYDCSDPSVAVEVQLWDGKRLLGAVPTLHRRNDVNTKFNITGDHGFHIPVPEQLFDGLHHKLTLTAAGEQLSIPQNKRLPDLLNRSLLQDKPQRYTGRVERVDAKGIDGWAANLMSPFRPVNVALLVDGVCVAIVLANQFQKRLQTVTQSGCHAFRFNWPTRLMNSTWRTIEAKIVEGDVTLLIGDGKNPQRNIFFPLIDFFASYDSLAPRRDTMSFRLTNIVSRPGNSVLDAKAGGAVSVIILNWNGAEILRHTLTSIAQHFTSRPVEVIVVDHGSVDESLDVIKSFEGQIDIKAVPRNANFSFSSSNNLAAGMATGEYLFFVNNDIVFTRDCLPAMADWLERDAQVGIVGMRLVEPVPDATGTMRYETHHRGVQFQRKLINNDEVIYGPVELADEFSDIGAAYDMPVVTGAALLCRKVDFLAAGGFDEAYFYGMEDVDLCLRLSARLGKRVICDTSVTAIHNRSFTRTARLISGKPNPILANPKSQSQNHLIYAARFKRRIVHETLLSAIRGETSWRQEPLRVTFVVTDASFATAAGDFFTAMEMALALRELYGWETLFVKRDMQDVAGTDVLIVMRHDYDLDKVRNANPGLVTVAWIRNRVDEWLNSRHFQSYNLLFCSSNLAVRHVAEVTGRTAYLLPIATNEQRFFPEAPTQEVETDIVFTGNFWGHQREAVDILDQLQLPGSLAIYGHGWRDHPRWRRHCRRAVPYYEMPSIYPAAKLVIDDSHPVTRKWNSLNSRVFDALGSGSLVVTNCQDGARELFGDLLPTFTTGEELTALLTYYLEHPEEREALAQKLRAEVLEHHTYKNRARTFKEVLTRFAEKSLRFSIKIGVPDHDAKQSWGDWHFALGLTRALERAGHHARIDILPDWNCMQGASDDVVIVLRGLSVYKPTPSKINLLWLISHPDDVPLAELDKYDHVFVASDTYAEVLRRRLGDRVSALLQCTDPALFHAGDPAPEDVPELLFVGNSRGVRRPIIDDAIQAGLPVGVYGGLWEGIIPAGYVLGTYIPNDGLRAYYANAGIVLNDHWQDMKREGFISNRIYDAGACGAAIISDSVSGMADLFGDGVVTYEGADDLAAKASDLLADHAKRKALGARLKEIVLSRHTFDHRTQDILAVVKLFQ